MRSVPVVGMESLREHVVSLLRAVVDTSVVPFPEGCLDEAFDLAVGARSVGFGAMVLDSGLEAGLGELARAIVGAVIGERRLSPPARWVGR